MHLRCTNDLYFEMHLHSSKRTFAINFQIPLNKNSEEMIATTKAELINTCNMCNDNIDYDYS